MIKAIFYIGVGAFASGMYTGNITTDDVAAAAQLVKDQSIAAYEVAKPVAVDAYDYIASDDTPPTVK